MHNNAHSPPNQDIIVNKRSVLMSRRNQHSGHRSRLRLRFLSSPQESFYEHELLELLLFYVRPVVNTNGLAHDLIARFGNILSVMGASRIELEKMNGVGSETAFFLGLINDISLHYLSRSRPDRPLRSQEELEKYFCEYFGSSDAEICCILCSGTSDIPVTIPSEKLISGSISSRKLTETLLMNNTERIAIGINHPGGYPLPTEEDYVITRIFSSLAPQISVELTDSIIYGSGKNFSMRKNGAFSFNGR